MPRFIVIPPDALGEDGKVTKGGMCYYGYPPIEARDEASTQQDYIRSELLEVERTNRIAVGKTKDAEGNELRVRLYCDFAFVDRASEPNSRADAIWKLVDSFLSEFPMKGTMKGPVVLTFVDTSTDSYFVNIPEHLTEALEDILGPILLKKPTERTLVDLGL
jgi:hypothetical protein